MPCHRPRIRSWIWLAVFTSLAGGCTATKQSNTARTATEQLLISNAVDQSLNKVDFTPLGGSKVFVDEKYIDCVDKGYIIASVRHKLLQADASLVSKSEDADAIMELRSGGVGTDVTSSYLGIPGFTVPGMIGIPDIKFINRDSQKAVAKLGIVVYDPNSKHELGEGGVSMAKADDTNTYVLGIGPHQSGSLLNEVNRGTTLDPKQPVREFPNEVTFSPADYQEDPVPNRRVKLSGGYRRD